MTENVAVDDNVAEFVGNLRTLADFYEAHPTLPIPIISSVNAFVYTRKDLAAAARAVGSSAKEGSSGWFYLRKWITPSLILDINIERAKVCTSRIVGCRMVAGQPARVEEIVEWDCASVFAETEDLGLVAVPEGRPVVEYGGVDNDG